jgi:NAD(P)-dependent dehydrogenase (short-subunit alcohol dehydrogenase family)
VAFHTEKDSTFAHALLTRLRYCYNQKLAETVAEIEAAGSSGAFFPANLREAKELEAAIAECIAKFGAINILINAAGLAATFNKSADAWDEVIDINLKTAMRSSKTCLDTLKQEHKKGNIAAIINIGSLSGVQVFGWLAPCTHFVAQCSSY